MATKKRKPKTKELTNRQKLAQAKKLLKQAIASHKKSIETLNLALQHTHEVESVLAAYGAKCPPERPAPKAAAAAAYGAKCPPTIAPAAAYGAKCPPQ